MRLPAFSYIHLWKIERELLNQGNRKTDTNNTQPHPIMALKTDEYIKSQHLSVKYAKVIVNICVLNVLSIICANDSFQFVIHFDI